MTSDPTLLERLLAKRLLVPSGVDGLYGRSGAFESIIAGIDSIATRVSANDGTEWYRFPPAMARVEFERSGYMKSFPQLAGTVHAFCGDDHGHGLLIDQIEKGEDWSGGQEKTDLVLVPAACYPLYPMVGAQGPIRDGGRSFDIQSYTFRHEPSKDPARMQLFRMRENVRVGNQEQVLSFREMWIERAKAIMTELQLPFDIVPANDPFFGRTGRLLKASQREQGLKYELVIPVANTAPTACMSFNYHQDHFSQIWDLRFENGERAHTGCIGFGLERIALALLRHHDLDLERWPAPVRKALWGQ
jgi:seryl-tRNA synthetase